MAFWGGALHLPCEHNDFRLRMTSLKGMIFALIIMMPLLIGYALGHYIEQSMCVLAELETPFRLEERCPFIVPVFVLDDFSGNLNPKISHFPLLLKGLLDRGGIFNDVDKRAIRQGKICPYYDFSWNKDVNQHCHHRTAELVNAFPASGQLTKKDGLTRNLNALRSLGNPELTANIDSYFPRSYVLTNSTDTDAFIDDFYRTGNRMDLVNRDPSLLEKMKPAQPDIDGDGNIWIVKPFGASKGLGVRLFSDIFPIMEYILTDKRLFIGQKYLERPFLIDNKKFHIRQHVLLTNLDPLTIYMFNESILLFSVGEYDLSNITDAGIHVVNGAATRTTSLGPELYDHQSSKQLRDKVGHSIYDDRILPKLKNMIATTFRAFPQRVCANRKGPMGFFQIFGLDIMLATNLDPYLLEVNANPALLMVSHTSVELIPKVVDGILAVLFDSKSETASHISGWDLLHRGLPLH